LDIKGFNKYLRNNLTFYLLISNLNVLLIKLGYGSKKCVEMIIM